ncbi:hypothetical protein BSF_29750 [Bacillus subtilis]|nr:hypothetical protein BSF_29750 [Bacillus subtilis]
MSELTRERKNILSKESAQIASKYRRSLVHENEPIKDTFGILENLGFFIVKFPAHDDLSGFHIKKSNYDFIFINSAHSLGRQYFSAWHEYYHAISGEESGISLSGEGFKDEDEFKADCFASNILLPKKLIYQYLKSQNITNVDHITYYELITMQNYFRVSYGALITKLKLLFPDCKNSLNEKKELGSIENKEKLLKLTIEYNGDTSLIKPTNDLYITPKFYKRLEENYQDGRVSEEKVQQLLGFLESLRDKHDS